MKTGLTKRQKTTVIYFDEYSDIIDVNAHEFLIHSLTKI